MTVLVGHSLHPHDRAAISCGAMLARSRGLGLHVVTVVPAPWPTPLASNVDREYAEWAGAEGEWAIAAAATVLAEVAADLDTRVEAVPGRSVPRTLLARARETDARLVVIGSTDAGPFGRVALGATADRLLHSAELPVAVATRGFATHAVPRFRRATCAFRADRASERVLRRIAEICLEAEASLRVATFGVEGRTMFPPEVRGEDDVVAAYAEQARAVQEQALAEVRTPGDVEAVVSIGRDWADAVGRLDWRHDDILVLGSATGGMLARVLLGANAYRIMRHSPVPVVVLPET
jgi:nucleotide-binding universal stress UspA family protein